MKKHTIFGIFCLMLFFSEITVYAQHGFTGSGMGGNNARGQPVTVGQPIAVSEAMNLPRDSWVMLRGNITGSLPGGRYFTFRDSTGEITVEIEWDVWRGLTVNPNDTVEISGELEMSRGRLTVDVSAISVVGRTISPRQGQAVTLTQPASISEVRVLPRNSWVILRGTIVNMVRREYYTFRDSSGEILVEIDDDVWRGLTVSPSDVVEIRGEVDMERGQVSIDVQAIIRVQ